MYGNQFNPYNMQNALNFQNFGQQNTMQKQEVVRVSGRNGAEAYQMTPNSSALLLDDSSPIVWLKTTDGAGYPTLTPYSITPYKPEPEVDVKSLETRIAKLEEMFNAKSNFTESHATESRKNDAKQQHRSD